MFDKEDADETGKGIPAGKVSKKAEHAIIKGHPWVYFNEITEAQPFENGELVDVVSQKEAIWEPDLQTKTAKSVFV